jgi:hypothetical protein
MNEGSLLIETDRLISEANFVYENLVLPTWTKQFHGLPDVLYGYMMGLMARVDLASTVAYYCVQRNQTERMVAFLSEYSNIEREVANVLVYVWRHKLMHTSSPQVVTLNNNISYQWLLHWKEHLPSEQHLEFQILGNDQKVLNIGMLYFANEVRIGIQKYTNRLNAEASFKLQFEEYMKLQESKIKPIYL